MKQPVLCSVPCWFVQDTLLYLQISAMMLPLVQSVLLLIATVALWIKAMFDKAAARRRLQSELSELVQDDAEAAALAAAMAARAKDPKHLWQMALLVSLLACMHLMKEEDKLTRALPLTHRHRHRHRHCSSLARPTHMA